jgi:YidC/Oxa1 family membrane protein insertase
MSAIIDFLASIMVTMIGIFHSVTHTYWIDIILLTMLVRLVISPVNRMQTQTMKKMNEIQPQMKELQEKFKANPDDNAEEKQRKAQEQQKKMMELYKKHNVNPFMSCFPMLIQMPILISLFWVLRSPRFYNLLPGFGQASMFGAKLTVRAYESAPFPNIESLPGMIDMGSLINTPFLMDKFLYLPALPLFAVYIATTILQTKQMQAQNPQGQSSQMNFMLPLFLWFGLIFPIGLLLYFALSNLFQMQQYASIRKADDILKAKGDSVKIDKDAAKPPPPPKKRKKKRRK